MSARESITFQHAFARDPYVCRAFFDVHILVFRHQSFQKVTKNNCTNN